MTLKVGSLALSQAFDADVTAYTATTSNNTNSITATAAEGVTVSMKLNGTDMTGTTATWVTGANTLEVIATDANGSTTYTVTVTK